MPGEYLSHSATREMGSPRRTPGYSFGEEDEPQLGFLLEIQDDPGFSTSTDWVVVEDTVGMNPSSESPNRNVLCRKTIGHLLIITLNFCLASTRGLLALCSVVAMACDGHNRINILLVYCVF